MDNPKNMCSPINAGSTAGFIIFVVYILTYFLYRGLDYIVNPLINLVKHINILNTVLVPVLKSMM